MTNPQDTTARLRKRVFGKIGFDRNEPSDRFVVRRDDVQAVFNALDAALSVPNHSSVGREASMLSGCMAFTEDAGKATLSEVYEALLAGTFYDDYDWASGPALRAVRDSLALPPSVPAGVSEDGDLVARLRGRARFCRDRGELKTPELFEQAAAAIEASNVAA